MKNPNIIVRVPEPCHEDWNKMTPEKQGRFCSSCSKTVVDFSNKTDTEISTILLENKDQKMCGHFKASQVNRPLSFKIDMNNLPKNMSVTKVFAVALFIAFGTFLFSCTNYQGQKVGKLELENYEYVKGDIAAPIDDTLKTETGVSDSLVSICTQETLGGAIAYEFVPQDSIIEIAKPEMMTVGMIEPYYEEPKDSIAQVVDSTLSKPISVVNNDVVNKETIFSVFPNPSKGDFTLQYDVLKRNDVRVDVYTLTGSLVKNLVDIRGQYEGKYKVQVNLNELPNGIYLVNLLNGEKRSTQKVVIEK